MKITSIPDRVPPERGILALIKYLRAVCGIPLVDAKKLADQVRRGEAVTLPLHPREDAADVLHTLRHRFLCGVEASEPVSAQELRESVAEVNEEALFCDGLDGALIGYVERFGQPPVALYDRARVIELLMDDMECDECSESRCEHMWEHAEEHFQFNVIGAWVGENTPAFATLTPPGR